MFYYQTVLERRTGCFSTIWLAATKGRKLGRRDYMSVNVPRTCNDIMDYVLLRVPPPQSGLPRPRFSLYLSSQLQYGTVVVYHRQCTMLLTELQITVERLSKARTVQRIDMEAPGRSSLNLSDSLSVLEAHEWAQDPFFGQMHAGYMPSPSTLMQLEVVREASPEHPLVASPETPPLDGLTVPPASITLVEREPASFPSQFEGADLTEAMPEDIDLLLEQPDEFPGWERERDVGPDQERPLPLSTSPVDLQPPTLPSEDVLAPPPGGSGLPTEKPAASSEEKDVLAPPPGGSGLPTEKPAVSSEEKDVLAPPPGGSGLPTEKPAASSEEKTPVSAPRPPSPPSHAGERRRESPTLEDTLPPGTLPPRKRRRRRQLFFIDQQTQIPDDALREQMNDPLIETKPLVTVQLPHKRTVSPVDLLGNPCTAMAPEMLLLWQQAAVIRPLTGAALQAGERGRDTDSERERELAAEEGEQEIPRERTESSLLQDDVSAPSLLAIERSDRDLPPEASPLDTPTSKGSPGSRPVSRLVDIPEEGDDPQWLPEAELTAELAGAEHGEEGGEETWLFRSLLPPMADRRTVAHSFWILLENVAARRLCVQQDEPYGDISITPGPNYDEDTENI